MSVLLDIDDVVENVNGTGNQTECGKGQHHLAHQRRVMPGMAKQQADKDEGVFYPLVWTHEAQHG